MFERFMYSKTGTLVRENRLVVVFGLAGIAVVLLATLAVLISVDMTGRTSYRQAFALTEDLMAEGNYRQALAVYEEKTGGNHYDPSFYMGFGGKLETEEKIEEALAIYKEGYEVTGDPVLAQRIEELAKQVLELRKPDENTSLEQETEVIVVSDEKGESDNQSAESNEQDSGKDENPESTESAGSIEDAGNTEDPKNTVNPRLAPLPPGEKPIPGLKRPIKVCKVKITLFAATTNSRVKGAEVNILAIDGSAVDLTLRTNGSGTFNDEQVPELEPGEYVAIVSRNGFITEEFPFTVEDDEEVLQINLTLCEKLNSNEKMRIVLIWEDRATDLDASLEGKINNISISANRMNLEPKVGLGGNRKTIARFYEDVKSGYGSEVISVYSAEGNFTYTVVAARGVSAGANRGAQTDESNSSGTGSSGSLNEGDSVSSGTGGNGVEGSNEEREEKTTASTKDISDAKPIVKIYTNNNEAPQVFTPPKNVKGEWKVFTLTKGAIKAQEDQNGERAEGNKPSSNSSDSGNSNSPSSGSAGAGTESSKPSSNSEQSQGADTAQSVDSAQSEHSAESTQDTGDAGSGAENSDA